MEKIEVMGSHGKSKKCQKSWKNKNFTLICAQNLVTDVVVFKISTDEIARIQNAEMVIENHKFYLVA